MNRENVLGRFTFITLVFMLSLLVVSLDSDVLAQQSIPPVSIISPAALESIPVSPAYDSGWQSFALRPDPISFSFNHNLGGDPDDYLVDLQCRDDSELNSYECKDKFFQVVAHWYALTDTSIKVWIKSGDDPDDVRLRIYLPSPDFDSDWQALLSRPDPIGVQINLPQINNPDNYWVSLECKDDAPLNTYDCTDNALNINAHWYDFVANSISLWVQSSPRPDEVRVRLYQVDPDYDSGWYTIGSRPDPLGITFAHNLRGDPENYHVELQCKDDAFDTYGCADFNFAVNALWYDLTGTSIEVWVPGASRPDQVRIQIVSPDKAYLPAVMKK
jgi:hypothetical protein